MVKFYSIPFARDGLRNDISESVDPNGKVSFTEGYTEDYQRDLNKDPKAKDIDRGSLNGIFFNITQAIGNLQRNGNEEWSELMVPYQARSMVLRNGFLWVSNINNNRIEPKDGITEWTKLIYQPGTMEDYNNSDWSKLVTNGLLNQILGGTIGSYPKNNFNIPGNWTDRLSGFGARWGYVEDERVEKTLNITFNEPFKQICFGAAILMDQKGVFRGDSTYNYRVVNKDRYGMTMSHGWNESTFHWIAFGF